MSSSQVPLWVPLVVALFGLIGVVFAQVIAGWREDRRWRREAEREELRWQREREARQHEARANAYAELIGVVEAFDFLLFEGRQVASAGRKLDAHLAEELRSASAEARRALGPINLHAPERIRSALRDTVVPRVSLSRLLLDGTGEDRYRSLWDQGQREYKSLRAEMRRNLGLDVEELTRELAGDAPLE
jgi:hypothetical protein